MDGAATGGSDHIEAARSSDWERRNCRGWTACANITPLSTFLRGGGIYAPKEVHLVDKGGRAPPCSYNQGFSLAGDTLIVSILSGLSRSRRRSVGGAIFLRRRRRGAG